MPEFVDTHCHIHEAVTSNSVNDLVKQKWAKAAYTSPEPLIEAAMEAGVKKLMCVGCTLADSQLAVALAQSDERCYASIGIHPHEAKEHLSEAVQQAFERLAAKHRVKAVGECGLDYFYEHSPKEAQQELLNFQLELAQKHGLPVIFHVREAFDDFWPIFDRFQGLHGVLHSYTDNLSNLEKALHRGLYIGLNGIMTFTKDEEQLAMARAVPLSNLLLETDAPFLTPKHYRGTICEPKHVVETATFLSDLRDETLEEIAAATTHNAKELFKV